MTASTPSRRTVLRVGLGLPALRLSVLRLPVLGLPALSTGLAGCTTTPDTPEPPPAPDPDVALTEQAVDRERLLLEAYDGALAAFPALAERLAPLRAEHTEHLAALGGQDGTPSSSPASPTFPSPTFPSPTPASPSPPATVAPPADPAAALAALAEAERAASARHGDAAVLAGRALAGVLAALAASEAAHPVALG